MTYLIRTQGMFITNIFKRYVSLGGVNNHLKSMVYAKKLDASQMNTHFISFTGPETLDFVNGLVTSKLDNKRSGQTSRSVSITDESFESPDTIKDWETESVNNYVAKQLVDTYKAEYDNLDEGTIRKSTLYSEQEESFGNIRGQLSSLLTSTSKVTTLMRLYTTLAMNGEHIIMEVPKQNVKEEDPDFDIIGIFGKHKRFKRQVKMIKDVQDDSQNGFNVWDVCFEASLAKSDMELEAKSYLFNEDKLNYLFNKKIHIDEHFNSDNVIAVYFDEILYSCSLLMEDSYKVYYRYRVLVKKDIEKVDSFVHPFYVENFTQNDVSKIQNIEQRYGLYDLCDVKPGTVLPYDLNIDYIPNAVSFDKGCYIGQELTTRMHSLKKIVKRGVPVEFQNVNDKVKPQVDWRVYTDHDLEIDGKKETSVFGNSNKPLKKRSTSVGKLIINDDKRNIRLVSLKTKYVNELFGNNNKDIKFYLLPSKEEIRSKGLNKEECKIPIEIKTPYWIDKYIEEHFEE